MASGTKSDFLSGSPDGHGYFNGPRGPYSSASLERSGSFREGGDNYGMFPVSSSSRSPAVDSATLLHSLAMELRTTTLDQKAPRLDAKKSLSSIFGISPEESTSTPCTGRNFPNSVEEIRRVKSNINDMSNKARYYLLLSILSCEMNLAYETGQEIRNYKMLLISLLTNISILMHFLLALDLSSIILILLY